MGTVLVSLVPLMVGAAALPLHIILTLLLLRTAGGRIKAAAFAAGIVLVRLLQGLIFGYVFAGAIEARSVAGGRDISSTLLLVSGILMLVTAAWGLSKEEDPDAPPPRWMKAIDGVSAPKAFAGGVVLMMFSMKQWIFTLSAIAIIDEARLGMALSVVAYLAFVVAAQSVMLAPIVLARVSSDRAAKRLDSERGWLERHNRLATVIVSSVLGLWFMSKGISGLLERDQERGGHAPAVGPAVEEPSGSSPGASTSEPPHGGT